MESFNPQEWTPGYDEHGVNCWFNKTTRGRVYGRFPPQMQVGLSPVVSDPGANVPASTQFNPASPLDAEKQWKQALAGAWREYQTDGDEKKPYWYNEISGDRTWDKPDTSGAQKPPPPPPPASSSRPPVSSSQPREPSPHEDNGGKAGGAGQKKKKESEQWQQLRTAKGRRYWYNEETGASQYDTPNCLRKYR
ncbi:unnamed protein product [Ectocarpus sp. 8 AP-2014]